MHNLTQLTGRLLSLQYGREPFTVLRAVSIETMLLLVPFLGAAFVFAVSAGVAQGGIVIKPFEFKAEALNPLNGMKKIFSINGLADSLKSFVKLFIGCYIYYLVIKKDLPLLPSLMTMGVNELVRTSAGLIMKAIFYGFSCFFVMSIIDIFIQRWQFERSIRMSKEDIRQEFKESEGNPMVKSRIKSIQREMAKRRMMQEVPKATVVITNPTHLAIALQYEDKEMAAPKILAKGAGFIAEKIREIARENNIPLVEDKPLARLLYKLEVNSYIPHELYQAVAKILAYIYRLRGMTA